MIEDETLATRAMNTTFKSWADMCDTEHEAEKEAEDSTPPMHGDPPVSK